MHRAGGVAKQGKYNPAVRGIQSPERYRDAGACPEKRVRFPRRPDSSKKIALGWSKCRGNRCGRYLGKSRYRPHRHISAVRLRRHLGMSGFDGSKQGIYCGLIDEIVAAVWDGPGTYGIEPLVPDVCSVDVTCFDIDGLKCELEGMFPNGLCRGNVDIIKY